MVIGELRKLDASFILDGFPRTRFQAERIYQEFGLDLAVHFYLPDDILIKKMGGRRVCDDCKTNFNVTEINEGDIVMPSMAPKEEGICDRCGGHLGTREDDKPHVIRDRLKLHHNTEGPIIEFYQELGHLLHFDVKRGIDDVPEIIALMKKALFIKSHDDYRRHNHKSS